MTTDDAKIIESAAERLAFFFSNANLRRDKFLRNELDGNDGFVGIDILLKFNTLKQHTTDAAIVAKAAKHDSVKGLIKLSEDSKKIARVSRFEEYDNIKLSLRISNLPVEDVDGGTKKYKITRDQIKDAFAKYGTVALVDMHFKRGNNGKKSAAGVGTVEFENAEGLEKAVSDLVSSDSAEPPSTIVLGDDQIKVKSLAKWLESKKGDRNSSKKRERDTPKKEYKEFVLEWQKGTVISIKGVPDDCDREKIIETVKTFLGHEGDIKDLGAYADYSRGEKNAAIRFTNQSEKIAELAGKLGDGSVTIGGSKVESSAVLDGEDEETYYKKFIAFKNKIKKQKFEDRYGN
jgi:hypothetical protein